MSTDASEFTDRIGFFADSRWDLLQEPATVAQCIEWQASVAFYSTAGRRAFTSTSGGVPYVATNDGRLATHAAKVAFDSLESLGPEHEGSKLLFVEIGIGTGLFAKYFLDCLRTQCDIAGRARQFESFVYLGIDFSEAMLNGIRDSGILNEFGDTVRLARADAIDLSGTLKDAISGTGAPCIAVFLNYVLDSLPPAVLTANGSGELFEYKVRTFERKCPSQADRYKSTPGIETRESAEAGVSQGISQEGRVVAVDYVAVPADVQALPFGTVGRDVVLGGRGVYVLNYGALALVEFCCDLVVPGGFIILADYGFDECATLNDPPPYQNYAGATSMGLDLRVLSHFVVKLLKCYWVKPDQDDGAIFIRCIGRPHVQESGALRAWCCPSYAQRRAETQAVETARELARDGRLEQAVSAYTKALRMQKYSWPLLEEFSRFLLIRYGHPDAARYAADAAVRLNPVTSSAIWCTLGDALADFDNSAAENAFRKAAEIDSLDARAYLGLTMCSMRRGNLRDALLHVASGLHSDVRAEYRERLVGEQSKILAMITDKQRRTSLSQANHWRSTITLE